MKILAIDPGPEESGYVWLEEDGSVCKHGKCANDEVPMPWEGEFVIEMVASYGMPVGAEVFETVYWIGRFCERWEYSSGQANRVFRKDVKMHLCGHTSAKDSNIRQALIDRYGPGKQKAIGLKKTPGPLYGIKGDVWQALALGCYWLDTRGDRQ